MFNKEKKKFQRSINAGSVQSLNNNNDDNNDDKTYSSRKVANFQGPASFESPQKLKILNRQFSQADCIDHTLHWLINCRGSKRVQPHS